MIPCLRTGLVWFKVVECVESEFYRNNVSFCLVNKEWMHLPVLVQFVKQQPRSKVLDLGK